MKNELSGKSHAGSRRDSNMEALRIVAMTMILCIHMLTHAITHRSIGNAYYLWYPVLSCGVDIFFMISGWFGIKWSWRSFIRLLLIMVIFNAVNIVGSITLGVAPAPARIIEIAIFPFGHEGGYWFMQVYLLLMVVAPVVSRGLDAMDRHSLRVFILVFSIVTFYFCWLGHNQCNRTGYSDMQALYLYCLARWMRRDDVLYRNIPQWACMTGFFAITIALGIAAYHWPVLFQYEFYNSLPIVAASALMVVFFSRLSFRSRAVNAIATASLGCYLLQDGLIGQGFVYRQMHEWWTSWSLWQTLAAYLGVYLLLWLGSYLVTFLINKLVQALFHKFSA